MYSSIVMTSGVSLLAARNYFGKWTRDREYFEFSSDNPQVKSGEDTNEILHRWLNDATPLINERKWTPEHVSAEYSMLYSLRKQNKIVRNPVVTLFHTDTFAGIASAELLKQLIECDFSAVVHLHSVKVDVTERTVLNRSIGNYMYELSKALQSGHPSGTCFAPIGGYKVMTSFGYIVGSFHGYPTAYLHEEAQYMLHIIPPVPIDIDESFVSENLSFIRRLILNDLLDYGSLTLSEKNLVESHPSLFMIEDDCVYLNPFGFFIFSREQYRSQLQTKFFISEAVARTIKAHPSQRRFVFQQLSVLADYAKDDNVGKRGELYHERDFQQLNNKSLSYHLYKGASNGGLFRAAWRYDNSNDELYINYVWLEKPYEHDVLRGKGLVHDEGKFIDITDEVYETI